MYKKKSLSFGERAKKFWRDNREGWMFVLPLVIGLGVFTAYPMIQSLIYSFHRYKGTDYYFNGWTNYVHILTKNRDFWGVVGNTCFYAFVSVPIVLVSSYLIATLVNQKVKGVGIFRVIYYLPCVIPGVVGGLLWKDIFSQNGIFNQFLALFGGHCDFFESGNKFVAIPSIFLMNMWSIGGGMILWLSAFKSIPNQLYEAAEIDGATFMQKVRFIVWPLCKPTTLFLLVTGIIGSFQVFMNSYMMTGGGPDNNTTMVGLLIFNNAFVYGKYGIACAQAVLLTIIIAILTAVQFKISGDDVEY